MGNQKTTADTKETATTAGKNRQERMRIYRHGKEQVERLNRVIDRVLAGETETTACLEENVDKHWIRRFVRGDISIGRGQTEEKDGIRVELDDWICWQDKFLIRLTGTEYYAPVDFDEAYEECVNAVCTEQEKEVLRMRYQEGMTMQAIGDKLGKSRARIDAVEHKAMRKLRHPQYRLHLIYGKEYQEQSKKVKTAQAEYDRARMTRMKQLCEGRRDAIQRLREKEEQIKEEIKALETMDSSCLPDSLDEIPISEAEFSVRAVNALSRHQIQGASGHIEFKEPIKTIGQLAKISYEELCGITNLGMRTVKDIENVLFREYGIKRKRG